VAHANALGSTHYVGDGDPLPSDLNEDVRLVGPGAPAAVVPERPLTRAEAVALIDERVGPAAEVVPDPPMPEATPAPDSTPPQPSGPSSDPGDYDGQTILVLRALCRARGLPVAGAKAELVVRLNESDLAAVA
jgi:hypothetical protein